MNPMVGIASNLAQLVDGLTFGSPTHTVYNPLRYAWDAHRAYLDRWGSPPRKVVLLGMNPGPWGMVQTGVPFGEVTLVRDWLGIHAGISQPERIHPRRPIQGFTCRRSEISGARLWGWARDRFGTPQTFFRSFFVYNYCPLAFLEESGRNRTPDKLPRSESEALFSVCDAALRETVLALETSVVVGVGGFAESRARAALAGRPVTIGRILHPSPASPLANRGWAAAAERDLAACGITLIKDSAGGTRTLRLQHK